MDNLEEMGKFLEKYNISKLHQEKLENMNREIISIEIKTMIKSLPTDKIPGPDSFKSRFYHMFREELTPILLQLSENSQTHMMRLQSPWYQNQTKTAPEKKITDQYHWWKQMQISSTKFWWIESNNTLKGLYAMIKWDLSQGCKNSSI